MIDQIAVTPAMFAVGRSVLLNHGYDVPEEVLARVYSAMREVAPSGYRHAETDEE